MPLPAAPRPICPTVLWQRLTSERRAALMRAASVTTAVPCWSSCSTGFCRRACSSCSISKHSGAAKSSSWMAPNEVAIAATMSATRAGCVSSSRIGTPLMPTRSANSAALPSMTGSPASAPMLPSPRTAVPLVTMATVRPRAVKSSAACASFWMARHTRATPGV